MVRKTLQKLYLSVQYRHSWFKLKIILKVYQKKFLMTFKIKYSQTVRNFSVTCHLVHSMVLTALMRNHLKVSFRTGGVRV
ncbi:Uncharacterised protein [Acinetobacter baumannii]|nr:Uncharacterised protein [Acinetobacter baumannii]